MMIDIGPQSSVHQTCLPASLEDLGTEAKRELMRRKARSVHLPSMFFAEGCWNILLDVFVEFAAGKKISVTDACISSEIPMTTALRCVTLLEEEDLIARQPDASDRRRSFLVLTPSGTRRVSLALREMAGFDRSVRVSSGMKAQAANLG